MQTYRPRWRFLRVYWPSFLGLTDNAHYVVLSLPLFQYALKKNIPPPGKVLRAYKESPGGLNPSGLLVSWVRRRATLPHPVGCSTIAVPGLSFRVRNGTGRLTWAMAAANLLLYGQTLGSAGLVAAWEPDGGRDALVRLVFIPCSLSCGMVRSRMLAFQPGLDCRVAFRPLVPVGSTPRGASTSGLSTTCSAWGLQGPVVLWNAYLGAGFPLRCFQRLSLPNVANRPCHWRDNRHTRGSSTQVLSYYGQASSTFRRAQRIETKLSHDVLNPARVPL
ncbi:hypothetical protein BBRP734_01968 [Bifidobacterium breve]|nr:hypothetical protein BBRP734_01968 [Bifidobacterium breve]